MSDLKIVPKSVAKCQFEDFIQFQQKYQVTSSMALHQIQIIDNYLLVLKNPNLLCGQGQIFIYNTEEQSLGVGIKLAFPVTKFQMLDNQKIAVFVKLCRRLIIYIYSVKNSQKVAELKIQNLSRAELRWFVFRETKVICVVGGEVDSTSVIRYFRYNSATNQLTQLCSKKVEANYSTIGKANQSSQLSWFTSTEEKVLHVWTLALHGKNELDLNQYEFDLSHIIGLYNISQICITIVEQINQSSFYFRGFYQRQKSRHLNPYSTECLLVGNKKTQFVEFMPQLNDLEQQIKILKLYQNQQVGYMISGKFCGNYQPRSQLVIFNKDNHQVLKRQHFQMFFDQRYVLSMGTTSSNAVAFLLQGFNHSMLDDVSVKDSINLWKMNINSALRMQTKL